MTTKWDKSDVPEEEIYRMDEHAAINLHTIMDLDPEKDDPLTPRLIGTIREGNVTLWHTLCLSDYMRSSESQSIEMSNKAFILFSVYKKTNLGKYRCYRYDFNMIYL
jgi:hypothetical protein